MHRTQLYLDERRNAQLEARARATGRTKSALVRDAIDAYLDGDDADAGVLRMRAALADAAGVAAGLPSGAEYAETLRAGDADRARRLDKRR